MKRLSFAFFAALILAGCGSSPTTESTGTPDKPTGSPTGAPTKVVFIPKNSGNPYFDQVEKGFKDSVAGMNLDYATAPTPAVADPTSQLSVIKDQVQRGVDMIAISSNSPDALNEVLDQAKAKNVIVITVDSDLTDNESHRDLGVLPTDFSKIGPSQLELLASQINYEGEFAILSATSDAPNQNAWIDGMKTALKDAKYAKMKLVTIVYGDDDAQKSSTEAESLLTKFPNLRGIISPTSVGLAAAAQVLENAGVYPGGAKAKGAGVVLTGLSTPNQMKKAVEKGVVAKFQLWDPADMGIIAAYIGTQVKAKKFEIKPGATIEVPGHGTMTVLEKNIIFAGPLVTFDKTNISKYDY